MMCILILWIMFSVGCSIAPMIAIVYPFNTGNRYLSNFIKSADRLAATMLGFSGRAMLSTELAHEPRMTWMRDWLNEIEPGHCLDSAFTEGAYCRLSDRTIGIK
jgi:hypothetical protein